MPEHFVYYVGLTCYGCPYASIDRPADLSLGVFHELPKDFHPELPRSSISLLLVNSVKGAHIFDTLPLQREKRLLSEAVACNRALSAPPELSPRRSAFFAAFAQQPFQQVRSRFLSHAALPQAIRQLRHLLAKNQEKD